VFYGNSCPAFPFRFRQMLTRKNLNIIGGSLCTREAPASCGNNAASFACVVVSWYLSHFCEAGFCSIKGMKNNPFFLSSVFLSSVNYEILKQLS